jgi:hypothetical protein
MVVIMSFKEFFEGIFGVDGDKSIINSSNKFFCPQCVKLSEYKKLSGHHIECKRCGNLKVYKIVYAKGGNLPSMVYIGPSVKHRKETYMYCVACGINPVEFKSLSYPTTILGQVLQCTDTNQPTCFHCHIDMCDCIDHSICKNNGAKL